MLTALGIWGINTDTKTATAADTVSYWLPYLTTDTNAPVYCMVSNMGSVGAVSGSDDNVTSINFTVMANSTGNTDRYASNAASALSYQRIPIRRTRLLSFSGQTVVLDGTQIIDLTTSTNGGTNNTGTGSVAGFGGRLDFISSTAIGLSGSNANRSTFNCTTMNMACYQGTTSPKRNVVGYQCSDSGAVNTSGMIPGLYPY